MRKFILILTLFAVPAFSKAAPPQAALSWTAPTTNTDGTTITATLTYNLYQGLAGALTKVQSGLTGLAATVTTGLTPGSTQCFAVTAIEAGVEGAQSNVACAAIPLATPGAPGTVTVVITGN
jgi:hypothetical protein